MRLQEAEKKLNGALLHLIIGFSFIADSKEDIGIFLKKHTIEIMHHLLEQYKFYKERYLKFKQFLKETKEELRNLKDEVKKK
ncbi:MAG: hypothetical protein WCO66_03685 [Candidatus Absconditabacteria bacterium]